MLPLRLYPLPERLVLILIRWPIVLLDESLESLKLVYPEWANGLLDGLFVGTWWCHGQLEIVGFFGTGAGCDAKDMECCNP